MNLNDPTLLRTDSYVNGAWTKAKGDKRFAVTNPANGAVIAEVADLGAAEVTAAIDAAVPAQKECSPCSLPNQGWSPQARQRARTLRSWRCRWSWCRCCKRDDARAIATYRDDGKTPEDIRALVGL